MERNPWLRAVLVLVAIISSIWLLGWLWEFAVRFADIIIPFFLAWLLAFVLSPFTVSLTRIEIPWRGARVPLPRGIAAAIVYAALILLLVLMGIILAPIAVSQAAQLGASLPQFVNLLPSITDLQSELTRRGIPVDLSATYQQQTVLDQARQWGGALAQNALGIATGVALVAFNVFIVLVLSFYMTLDGPRITRGILGLVPERYQDESKFFSESISRTFGGFIRGQLLQAGIYGAGTAVVMALAGLQYVAAVSSFSALAMIIPFIGPFIAIVPPLAISALQSPATFVWVLIALVVLQQLVVNLIAPKVMSEAVGLHPLLVLMATMIGIKVAGFWGALFGVPVVGVLYAAFNYLIQRSAPKRAAGSDDRRRVPRPQTESRS